MNNGIKCTVAFILGAVAGAAVSWKVLEEKYKQIAQEEIDSVKEVFSQRQSEWEQMKFEDIENEPEPKQPVVPAKPDIRELASKIQEEGYVRYSSNEKPEQNIEENVERPYVIAPDEFGEIFEYETISLTYYADGILADDMDELVDDVEDVVGLDFHEHFGEYEDDSVFIRNDVYKADYEILLDPRNYADIVNLDPHQAGDE